MVQQNLFEPEAARSLLDQLLTDSKLYTKSKDYKELLDFVVKLRNFAPFNAMLLQVQKSGVSHAASARDWRERFGRTPKEGARPLLILWPFGPVALVYDVQDTDGDLLPEDVASFSARGNIEQEQIAVFIAMTARKNIDTCWVDAGDQKAGSIRVIKDATKDHEFRHYRMQINRNHPLPVQFTTLAHELAHLFLGHLGPDKKLKITQRPQVDHDQQELEAESVAFLVCARNGVQSKSETYLNSYVAEHTTVDQLDLYKVMHAAGQVETLLGLAMPTKYDKPQSMKHSKRFKIGEIKLCEPDHEQILIWARQLKWTPEKVLEVVLSEKDRPWKTKVIDGHFVCLAIDSSVLPLINFDWTIGAAIKSLALIGNKYDSLASPTLFAKFDLSHMPNLRSLRCSGMPFASLDLSHTPNLTQFECYRSQITSLDFSHTPHLKRLECCGNQITCFNLSNTPCLTEIFCPDNKLTSLDLSNMPILTSLMCNNNQLASLNVSNKPDLTEISCEQNQLTRLDLSNTPNLQRLWCRGNQFINLDLSRVPELAKLKCADNPIKTLDFSWVPNLKDCDWPGWKR